MNTFIYTSSDATIYKHKNNENLNTGFDEILELTNEFSEERGHHVSRLVLNHNIDFTSVSKTPLIDSEFYLNLKITESKELVGDSEIEVFPLKRSWEEGHGRKYDGINTGVTWNLTSDADSWSTPGGDFYEADELYDNYGIEKIPTFVFKQRTSDVVLNITEYVKLWISGFVDNNGILVKFKNETISSCGGVSFFSKDTNTIYAPYIKTSYYDYIFDPCGCEKIPTIKCLYDSSTSDLVINTSGSLNELSETLGCISGTHDTSGSVELSHTMEYSFVTKKPSISYISHDNLSVSLVGLKSKISTKEQLRIKVAVRDKYPVKTFKPSSCYTHDNFVDFPIYYSVIDADTLERVLDFNKYSRVSCNHTGHYFDFDFGCLAVGRVYYFEIRVESTNQTKIYTNKIKFVIER